jgi:hypothetical protein
VKRPAQEPLKQVAFKQVPETGRHFGAILSPELAKNDQMVFSMISFLESVSSGMK